MKKYLVILVTVFVLLFLNSFMVVPKFLNSDKTVFFDSIKPFDSIRIDSVYGQILKFYKNNVHASYYHDKFNGRKTASGERFDNSKFTAAHKKLKFGTKVLVTNPINGKSVLVTVNDRGPFVKGREIDLSKKAFMEITHNKKRGFLDVNIEIVQE